MVGPRKPLRDLAPEAELPPATSFRKLVEHSGLSLTAYAASKGIPQTTYRRIAFAESEGRISELRAHAEKLGYGLWQLLDPNFDPGRDPPMADPQVQRVAVVFASLSERDKKVARAQIEQFASPTPAQPPETPTEPLDRRPEKPRAKSRARPHAKQTRARKPG